MKTYMPLNGLRWSRNSGSANCDMLQSDVLGRPGGGHRQMNWTDNPIISWGRLYILYLLSHTQIIMISKRTQAGDQLLLFRKDLGLIGDFVVCYFCEGSNETDAFFCTFFPHDIWPYASLYFTDVSLVK